MKKFFLALSIMAALSTATLCGGSNDTLATFDGGSITQRDAERDNEQKFFEIRMEEYQLRHRAAMEKARERIFELEAKKRNMTVEKFIETEVSRRRGQQISE
ncbi:MAG: hypothetical protein JNJ69_05705, partial [Leptospiraceae bacterium]|nr:hypothetical protein [Leptospiraceae bacterium]